MDTKSSLGRNLVPGRVSIVIPAYNSAKYISASIESCLSQSYADIEVIVVNDGSTDKTAEVLATFGSRINVLHKSNGGVADARNSGTRVATGEFYALMDNDDLMLPDKIRIQADVLKNNPDIVLVSTDFSAFREGKADFEASHINTYYSAVKRLAGIHRIYPTVRPIIPGKEGLKFRVGNVHELLVNGNFVHPPTVMVRTTALLEAGDFDKTLAIGSEYEFFLRASRIGPFGYLDQPLLRYRRSPTQLSASPGNGKVQFETIRILEKVIREEPAFYEREPRLFQHKIALEYTDAARSIGPTDRWRALYLLWRGMGLKVHFNDCCYALARIITPRFVVAAVKRAYSWLRKPLAPRVSGK